MITKEQEELLRIAKEKYPIGTKFKNISGGYEECSTKDPEYFSGNNITVAGIGNGSCVYLDGKWAEVVSLPEGYQPKEIIFPIFN